MGRGTGLKKEGGRGRGKRRNGGYTGRGIVFECESNDEDQAEVQYLDKLY